MSDVGCLEVATALKTEGNTRYAAQEYAEALRCYQQALDTLLVWGEAAVEKDALRVILYSNSSQVLICMSRWDEAMEAADKALDIDPDHKKSIDRRKLAFESRQATFNTKVGDRTLTFSTDSTDAALKRRSLTEGVALNNEGVSLASKGEYEKALQCFREALAIKLAAYGEMSFHYCISLSGVADALLSLGRLAEAEEEASRMLRIATHVRDPGQLRIAKEILADIARAKKRQQKK